MKRSIAGPSRPHDRIFLSRRRSASMRFAPIAALDLGKKETVYERPGMQAWVMARLPSPR